MYLLDRHTPNDWNYKIDKIIVSQCTREFLNVESKISPYSPKCVYRLENPYSYGQYLLQKEAYETLNMGSSVVKELFHFTSTSYIDSILQNNFDYRKVGRAKYGKGISFSANIRYAYKWATNKSCVLIADVLIGKERAVCNWPGYCVPPESYDTTTSGNGNVYVKYFNNEFYPKYAVYL